MKEGSFGHERTHSTLPLLAYSPTDTTSPPQTPPLPNTTSIVKHRSFPFHLHRRRVFILASAFLLILTLAGLTVVSLTSTSRHHSLVVSDNKPQPPDTNLSAPSTHLLQHSPYLRGPPAQTFRNNLRKDIKYISSWISAGWNNDVMTYMNLLYIGKITDRVSIIGTFTPSHIGGDAPPIAFGEVFNVSRFIQDSKVPMVEWDDVKDPDSKVIDALGCWNIWEAVQYYEHYPRGSPITDWVGLDVSYTRGPDWLKLIPNYEHSKCSTFWSLARLAYPEDRNKFLGKAIPSPHYKVILDPDDHLLCFDYLYYACAQQDFEFQYEYAPQWKEIGKHLYWSEQVKEITHLYLRKLLGLPENGEILPYIAIHARHGDFNGWCWEAARPEECFAPLSVIARRIKEVQDELRNRKQIDIPDQRVIMTSDEKDEAWWDEVKKLGWIRVDHQAMNTVEKYGRWFPVVLDAAIHSFGMGFVGTDRSTFSILSMRRVNDWQDGASRLVKWGKKDADAHRRRQLEETAKK